MGCSASRAPKELRVPEVHHGIVPPHLAKQLLRFAFIDYPSYVPGLPPIFSLACEEVFRVMPVEFWRRKSKEMVRVQTERQAISSQLREGKGIPDELRKVNEDLRGLLAELGQGYVVLDGARHKFFKYLQEHGVAKEYSWQALEEYAEGAVGGLSLYWPEAARRDCAEDAMVRAEWVVQRFDNERDNIGHLPPPQLAFLHSPEPCLASNPPIPITSIPPRHPSSSLKTAPVRDVPPPYTPPCQAQSGYYTTTPDLPPSITHSSDSDHEHSPELVDLVDLKDLQASSSSRSQSAI